MAAYQVVLYVLWVGVNINSNRIWSMKKPTNHFSNGNKQMLKEALAVVGMMLFLALVSVLLGWYKGMLVWPF